MLLLFLLLSLTITPVSAKDNSNNNNGNQNANVNANANSLPTGQAGNNSAGQNEERITNLDETLDQKREDLENIEAKIEKYSKILEIKRDQEKTLANQIEQYDNQIELTKEEIKKSEKDIDITSLEIQDLTLKVSEQTELLKKKQSALKVLINDLYRKDSKNLLEVLLSYVGISSFIQEIAYTEQANQQVFNKFQEINDIRKDLEQKQTAEEKKQRELEENRQKKLQKNYILEGEQNSREKLLADTQGEEGRYQEMLARIEEEKKTLLGDIEELSASLPGGLESTISHQPKPTSGLAGTDWYFSQRDPRWGGSDIGHSNTKMSKYGCAVTCVAMVLRYHGVTMNPGLLARQPIFSNDLIVWPEIWQQVKRVGGYTHGNINWDMVDKEISDRNPVIIFVRANGRGAGHYVVVHHKDKNGKYVVHDPYWGANIFLDSTRENIGVLYGSSTSIDQMIIYHNSKRDGETLQQENSNTNNSNLNNNGNSNKNKNANSNKQ